MNIRRAITLSLGEDPVIRLNDIDTDPESIRAILINEIVPEKPEDDFYGESGNLYLSTAIPLFQKAGLAVNSMQDILDMGVYITNAVKTPKASYTVEKSAMDQSLPWLEKELSLFANVKVIMLMGDVAKKMFNRIVKKRTKKNVIPSGATYKLRHASYYADGIRVIPSYIITGGNILIEKSKCAMIQEDIRTMAEIINECQE